MGGRLPLGWGEWSDPPDEAVDEEEGERPEDAVVRRTAGPPGAPPPPLIVKGLTLPLADTADAVDVSMLGAVDGGITPLKPPRVLEYVSRRDISPDPRWEAPYRFL